MQEGQTQPQKDHAMRNTPDCNGKPTGTRTWNGKRGDLKCRSLKRAVQKKKSKNASLTGVAPTAL